MLYEGNSNINRICDDDNFNNYCINHSQVVIDAQYQLLGLDSYDFTITNHFHAIGSKSSKFPIFDITNRVIDTVADNY